MKLLIMFYEHCVTICSKPVMDTEYTIKNLCLSLEIRRNGCSPRSNHWSTELTLRKNLYTWERKHIKQAFLKEQKGIRNLIGQFIMWLSHDYLITLVYYRFILLEQETKTRLRLECIKEGRNILEKINQFIVTDTKSIPHVLVSHMIYHIISIMIFF